MRTSGRVKTLVYFNRWTHADGLNAVTAENGRKVIKLDWHAREDDIWPVLKRAHGYQISSARHELPTAYRGDAPLLARCQELLAICTDGAGYDTLDLDACTAAGVLVANQAGANKEAVAEHTLGMMLALSKRLIETDRAMRRDRDWHRNDFIGNNLVDKTVGIIGLGHIGSRLATLCRVAFDMRVLAYDPYLTEKQFAERAAESVALETLLTESDFVTLHCPLSDETCHMIDADALARMKPSAYLVTTARGGIHDEAALDEALGAGAIRGAGLDVWDMEPPPLGHPLLRHDNVILSPHTAGVTDESRRQASLCAAEQWRDIFQGREPPRVLNPAVLPRFRDRYAELFGGAHGS